MSNTRKIKPAAAVAAPSEAGTTVKGPGGGTKPQLLGRGRYSIYQAPNGDGVVSYRQDDATEDSQQVVPAKFWSLLMKLLKGEAESLSPLDIMKVLMSK